MELLLTILHVAVSVFLILVVLLQAGRGGGMGAAFGGASAQMFGGRGAGNFLSRITAASAVLFMTTSLTLSYMSSRKDSVVRAAAEQQESKADEPGIGDGEEAAETTPEATETTTSEEAPAAADTAEAADGTKALEATPAEEPEAEP